MARVNGNQRVRFENLSPERLDYRLTGFVQVKELVRLYADNSGDRKIALERELSENGSPIPKNAIQVTRDGMGLNRYEAIAFDGAAPCPVSRYKEDTCEHWFFGSLTNYQSQIPNPCFLESFYQCSPYENIFVGDVGRGIAGQFPKLAALGARYYAGVVTSALGVPRDGVDVTFSKRSEFLASGEEEATCSVTYLNKGARSAQDQFWDAWNDPSEWLVNGQFPVINNIPAVSYVTIRDDHCDGLTDYANADWSNAKGFFEVNTWPSPSKRSDYVAGILQYFDPIFKDETRVYSERTYSTKALMALTQVGATVAKGDMLFVIPSNQGPLVVKAGISGVVQEFQLKDSRLSLRLVASPQADKATRD